MCDDPHDPRAFLHVDGVEHARSVLIGMLALDGLPCVDLWQAALDVASDDDRGIEQGRAILEYILPDNR